MIYKDFTCPYCGSHDFRKRGVDNHTKKRMYLCLNCHRRSVEHRLTSVFMPKILILDLESLPILAYTWGVWDQNVSMDQIKKDWCVLSWAAKWLYSTETMGDILTPTEAEMRDDKRIMQGLWNVVDKADVVIAHNAKNFDIKKMNARFIVNKIKPPRFFRVIDTLQVARGQFGFTMNKLDYINKILGLEQKIKTEFKLWSDCDEGDPVALKKMMEYNIRDVVCLEEAYLILRPWIKSHPNIGLLMDENIEVCATCGSRYITWDGNYYYTIVGKYSTYRCDDCGAVGRSRITALSLGKRQSLLTSLAQ